MTKKEGSLMMQMKTTIFCSVHATFYFYFFVFALSFSAFVAFFSFLLFLLLISFFVFGILYFVGCFLFLFLFHLTY